MMRELGFTPTRADARVMAASIARRAMSTVTKKPHLYYMSAWFCPFAHRARSRWSTTATT